MGAKLDTIKMIEKERKYRNSSKTEKEQRVE